MLDVLLAIHNSAVLILTDIQWNTARDIAPVPPSGNFFSSSGLQPA